MEDWQLPHNYLSNEASTIQHESKLRQDLITFIEIEV